MASFRQNDDVVGVHVFAAHTRVLDALHHRLGRPELNLVIRGGEVPEIGAHEAAPQAIGRLLLVVTVHVGRVGLDGLVHQSHSAHVAAGSCGSGGDRNRPIHEVGKLSDPLQGLRPAHASPGHAN